MNQERKNKLFFVAGVVFGLALLATSVGIITAQTWAPPTANFPNANVFAPLDTSSSTQKKVGGLILGTGMIQGSTVQVQPNQSLSSFGGSGVFYPKYETIGAYLYTDQRFDIYAPEGMTLPRLASNPQTNATGTIYYNTAENKIKLRNNSGWTDIGTGGAVTAPLALETNSGGIGIILKKKTNDTTGSNSPMLVFSAFGAQNIGFLDKKNQNIFSDLFHTNRANALTLPCDDRGCGGGGGGYVPPTDQLTQPIWWMRQQGTAFFVMASDPNINDLRYVLTLTKGGGVLAGGPNNSVIPGNGEYFEYRKSLGNYIQTAPSGTWCGLNAENTLRWSCSGYNPGNDGNPCPVGWTQFKFGKGSFGGSPDWKTCIKN